MARPGRDGSVDEVEDCELGVLQAAGHGGLAAGVRARGRARIHELAARITDPDARRSFLERITAHRSFV